MNWVNNYRQHRTRQDFGCNPYKRHQNKPGKIALLNFWFHPYTEWTSLGIIFISIVLLFTQMEIEHTHSVSWMTAHRTQLSIFNWIDLGITLFFIVELILKILIAPNKWYFIKNSFIDILSILPIFRMFRLARTTRGLRVIRLFKAMRGRKVLKSDLIKQKTHVLFRTESTAMMTYLLLSVLFGTVGIMIFEKGVNESFVSIGDGLWWCIVTITTVGYGDMYPITIGGKLVAVSIMFVGLSFYALLTGTISTVLIERAQSLGDRVMDLSILEDHIVICGWNNDIFDILETLMCSTDRNILIIAEHPEQEIATPRVMLLQGNPSNKETLKNGQIDEAYSAIILSEQSTGQSSQDSDAKSILVALAINICNPNLHTTIELQNPDNIEHARNAGANDFITATAYQGALLAQSASSPGVAKIFEKMFIDPETYLHYTPVPSAMIGKTYLTLVQFYTKQQNGVILGLSYNGQITLSPNPDLILTIDYKILTLSTPSHT